MILPCHFFERFREDDPRPYGNVTGRSHDGKSSHYSSTTPSPYPNVAPRPYSSTTERHYSSAVPRPYQITTPRPHSESPVRNYDSVTSPRGHRRIPAVRNYNAQSPVNYRRSPAPSLLRQSQTRRPHSSPARSNRGTFPPPRYWGTYPARTYRGTQGKTPAKQPGVNKYQETITEILRDTCW